MLSMADTSPLSFLRCYRCIDPDSIFVTCWTVVFVVLVLYICTVGLIVNTFDLDGHSRALCVWSSFNWLDLAIDTFFVIDIFCRAFVFAVTDDKYAWSGHPSEIIDQVDQVFLRYLKGGMLVDVVTGFPVQWIIMSAYTPCESAKDIAMLRLLRVFRVTRIFKLFQQPQVRKWTRAVRRRVGNNNVMQIWTHVAAVFLFCHVWTCLSWMIQILDEVDEDGDGRTGFEEWLEEMKIPITGDWFRQYTLLYSITLQNLFAIEPYISDQTYEGWFGILTLCLAVFINATMLSKILEIWKAINRAQTDLDERVNTVMAFLKSNGIAGALRNDILDYFEFRYSTSNDLDADKILLNHLPTDMQSRVIHKIFPDALNKSYLFSGSSEGFVAQCVLRMSNNSLRTMPGQVICAQGQLAAEMLFLKSGSAVVSVKDSTRGGSNRSIGKIVPGQCFGEISLWIESKRSSTVTSTSYSHLYVLNRADLDEVLQRYPEMVICLATNAIASCLRLPTISPALTGISIKASERLGRRMAFSKCEFEHGEILVKAGEQATTAFVIRSGKVTSELRDRLEILSDSRTVGLTELFAVGNYQESVRAKGRVLAYALTLHDVSELLEFDSECQLATLRATAKAHFKVVHRVHLGMMW
jgi:CRP-like cAMP-binding protein